MGRGRAKAKQTKVARELKYRPVGTDLNALRAELTGHGTGGGAHAATVEPDKDVDDDDPYAAYVTDDDEDEDEPAVDRWAAPR